MRENDRQLTVRHLVEASLVVAGDHSEVTSAYVHTKNEGLNRLKVDHHVVKGSQPNSEHTVFTLQDGWQEKVFDLAAGEATVVGLFSEEGEVRLNPVFDAFENGLMDQPIAALTNGASKNR